MALRLAETLAMVRLVSLLVSLNVPRESTESIVDVFLSSSVSFRILTRKRFSRVIFSLNSTSVSNYSIILRLNFSIVNLNMIISTSCYSHVVNHLLVLFVVLLYTVHRSRLHVVYRHRKLVVS